MDTQRMTLGPKLAEMKRLANAGVLFQSVQCHPAFAETQHVANMHFDDFVNHLRLSPVEGWACYREDISRLYTRLLDCGFFDIYLHIYFDVHRTTTYTTVVAQTKYAFDLQLARANTASQRACVANQFIDRASRVGYLRRLCLSANVLARESTRYFCFASVLDEMKEHALACLQSVESGTPTGKKVSSGATLGGTTADLWYLHRSGILKILLIAILVSPAQTVQHNMLFGSWHTSDTQTWAK